MLAQISCYLAYRKTKFISFMSIQNMNVLELFFVYYNSVLL